MSRILSSARYLIILPVRRQLLVASLLFALGGIALLVAALGLFVGLRAWSVKMGKETVEEEEIWAAESSAQGALPLQAGDPADRQE